MATGNFAITEGSGKNIATHPISEDAITKQIQRVTLNSSAGVEEGSAASPLQVSLANHAANATPVLVDLGAADTLGTVTTVGTVTTCSTVTNLAQMGGVNINLNTGIRATGTQRVTIATDDILHASAVDDVAIGTTAISVPFANGGWAVETDGTDPTSVSAEGDAGRIRCDRNRRLLVNVVHPNLWKYNGTFSSAQTDLEIKATPGANLSLYITDVVFSNSDVAGNMMLIEATAGAKTVVLAKKYMTTTSTVQMQFMTPIRITANTNLGLTTVSCAIHSVEVHGYIAP